MTAATISQTVFEFASGEVWLEFDATRDDAGNVALTKALQAEGKRRRKAGLPTGGTLRVRKESDQICVK